MASDLTTEEVTLAEKLLSGTLDEFTERMKHVFTEATQRGGTEEAKRLQKRMLHRFIMDLNASEDPVMGSLVGELIPNTCFVNTIPVAMIHSIAQFLDFVDLRKLGETCNKMNRIANDPKSMTNLYVSERNVPKFLGNIQPILSRFEPSKILSVEIHVPNGRPLHQRVKPILTKFLECCTNCEKLDLRGVVLDGGWCHHASLKEVQLHNCAFNVRWEETPESSFSELKSLSIVRSHAKTSDFIYDCLAKASNLRYLYYTIPYLAHEDRTEYPSTPLARDIRVRTFLRHGPTNLSFLCVQVSQIHLSKSVHSFIWNAVIRKQRHMNRVIFEFGWICSSVSMKELLVGISDSPVIIDRFQIRKATNSPTENLTDDCPRELLKVPLWVLQETCEYLLNMPHTCTNSIVGVCFGFDIDLRGYKAESVGEGQHGRTRICECVVLNIEVAVDKDIKETFWDKELQRYLEEVLDTMDALITCDRVKSFKMHLKFQATFFKKHRSGKESRMQKYYDTCNRIEERFCPRKLSKVVGRYKQDDKSSTMAYHFRVYRNIF